MNAKRILAAVALAAGVAAAGASTASAAELPVSAGLPVGDLGGATSLLNTDTVSGATGSLVPGAANLTGGNLGLPV
jgi:hypothetical protein